MKSRKTNDKTEGAPYQISYILTNYRVTFITAFDYFSIVKILIE